MPVEVIGAIGRAVSVGARAGIGAVGARGFGATEGISRATPPPSHSFLPKMEAAKMPFPDRTVPKGELRNLVTIVSMREPPKPIPQLGENTPRLSRAVLDTVLPKITAVPSVHPDMRVPNVKPQEFAVLAKAKPKVEVIVHPVGKAIVAEEQAEEPPDTEIEKLASAVVSEPEQKEVSEQQQTIIDVINEQVMVEAEEILKRKEEEFAADQRLAIRIKEILQSLQGSTAGLLAPAGKEGEYAKTLLSDVSAKKGTIAPLTVGRVEVLSAEKAQAAVAASAQQTTATATDVETEVVVLTEKKLKDEKQTDMKEEEKKRKQRRSK